MTKNEVGVALVSGCNPTVFSMLAGGIISPYKTMMNIIGSQRYSAVA